eukprot:6467265-Amphidinium_carterae.1
MFHPSTKQLGINSSSVVLVADKPWRIHMWGEEPFPEATVAMKGIGEVKDRGKTVSAFVELQCYYMFPRFPISWTRRTRIVLQLDDTRASMPEVMQCQHRDTKSKTTSQT